MMEGHSKKITIKERPRYKGRLVRGLRTLRDTSLRSRGTILGKIRLLNRGLTHCRETTIGLST